MSADPDVVHPGESVTIGAPAADCDLGYDSGKVYSLTLLSERDSSYEHQHFETDVSTDGSFTVEIAVPESFPAGPAVVLAHGSPLDRCADGQSCAAYQVSLTVTA